MNEPNITVVATQPQLNEYQIARLGKEICRQL
jgi:hypothetical protein